MVREFYLSVADWMAPILLMLGGAYLFCCLAVDLRSAIILSTMGGVAGGLAAKLLGW